MTDQIKSVVMGGKRMGVILWCVAAITFVVWTHLHYNEDIGAGAITAMTLIAAMGGVDVWKQGRLDKQ
jgi:hypothetical protein